MPGTKAVVNVVVEDKFTSAKLSSYLLQEPLRLRFSGPRQNVVNKLPYIEGYIGSNVNPLVLDLYNIALAVYVWDLVTPRAGIDPRDFRILISVSNRDKWVVVKNHLEATLSFLTGDNFVFHFVQGPRGDEFSFEKHSERKVSLFSGGLDSLAGVKWLHDQKKEALLVSHEPKGLVAGVQQELVDSLRNIAQGLQWFQVRAASKPRTGLEEKEFTQFSRSFLYLTLGSIFALQLGIDTVYIFENGVIALNIPMTQSRVYSNTRTAHPYFLMKYQELLAGLFGNHVSIENPFLHMTKGEVVRVLNVDGFRELIKPTVSCPNLTPMRWAGVKLKNVRHCGLCFPCVLRRVAIHYGALSQHDGNYRNNVFDDWSRLPEETRRLLLEMFEFCTRIDSFGSVDDALLDFHQFYMHEGIDTGALFKMMKRHVEQMRNCFSQNGSGSLKSNLRLR